MQRCLPATRAVCAFLLCVGLQATAAPANSPRSAHRIHFKRGATAAVVRGYLTRSRSNAWYVVRVRAGQPMRVAATALRRNAIVPLVQVTAPNGVFSTEKSAEWETRATRPGDYLIRVSPNLMASNSDHGPFLLRVTVR